MHKAFAFSKSAGALRKLAVAASLAAAIGAAHAGDTQEQARNAGIADSVSTAAGLALGAVEMNPIGPILGVGIKYAMFNYTKTLPDTKQPENFAMAASIWGGAAANNVCVIAAIVSGGTFAPACLAVGVVWGVKTWKDTEPERKLARDCARRRQAEKDPALPCMFTSPDTGLAEAALPPPVVEALPAPVALASESR